MSNMIKLSKALALAKLEDIKSCHQAPHWDLLACLWRKPLKRWVKVLVVGSKFTRRRSGSWRWTRFPKLSNAWTWQGIWRVEHEKLNYHDDGVWAIEIVVNKSVTHVIRITTLPHCGTFKIIKCKVQIILYMLIHTNLNVEQKSFYGQTSHV